jgi:hypothetical protein
MTTISIVIMVDVVGALAANSIDGNIYLVDNNKDNGSVAEGTGGLQTMVKQGDTLLWNVLPIEPEAFACISGILIDDEYCTPEQVTFDASDVTYWMGVIKKDLERVSYRLKFKLGTRMDELSSSDAPTLIGNLK